jgi:hypothetical protein
MVRLNTDRVLLIYIHQTQFGDIPGSISMMEFIYIFEGNEEL